VTRAPSGAVRSLLLVIVLLLAWTPTAAASTDQDLEEGARAYERGDFKQVIELIRPLLYPAIRLSGQQQVVQAYKLLGISYVFEKNRTAAARQFLALLSIRPGYRLDPLVDPAAAVELFEEVKKRNADKIRQILDRERREAERRRQQQHRRQAEADRLKLLASQGRVVIERTVVEHPYWINFIPLGAGQFQNGQRVKGFVVLGSQAALAALSLGTGLGVYFGYSGRPLNREEYDTARTLSVVQVASAALCGALVAYGIIDALVYHTPRSVTERRYRLEPRSPASAPVGAAKPSMFVVPSLGADGKSGGLGLGLTF